MIDNQFNTPHLKLIMQFEGSKIIQYQVDDEIAHYFYAEFYFKDEKSGILVGKSPIYNEADPDICLFMEDYARVHKELIDGKSWNEVYNTFRHYW